MARWTEAAVCALSDKAWTAKDNWQELLAECYDFALSDRNPYTWNGTGKPQGSAGTQGKDKASRKVYDSTLGTDAVRLTNRIQYELFPIGSKWAEFIPGAFVGQGQDGDARAGLIESARTDLEALREIVFTAIQLSNFDLAISEWLLELVVAGTACMLIQQGDDDNPIVYSAVTQAHVAFREGAFGKIDLISRRHKIRFSLIKETWKDATLPEVEEADRSKDPECDLIDVCYWSSLDKLWYYDVIFLSGSKKARKEQRIVSRESEVCPWVIARWSKATGEAQGRSLVMQALPDARVLSAVKSYLLRHAALAIGGVFMVRNDGIVNANNVRIFPGANIPVRATGGPAGASIAPLQVGGDVNLAQLVIQDLVQSIHKIMMNDGMPDIKDGVRTATELLERLKELQQSMGAPFSRILREGITPMLENTIYLLGKMNVIPLQPGQRLKLNSGQVQVRFASPLVQGQSLREVEAAQQAMAITQAVAGPEGGTAAVAASFKIEDFGAWVAGKLSVDPKLVRTSQERKTLQDQAGKVMAAQAGGVGIDGTAPGVPAQQQQPLSMAA